MKFCTHTKFDQKMRRDYLRQSLNLQDFILRRGILATLWQFLVKAVFSAVFLLSVRCCFRGKSEVRRQ